MPVQDFKFYSEGWEQPLKVFIVCLCIPLAQKEGPIGGGPRVFSVGDLVLQNELKVELENLKTFSEITTSLVFLQMALH